MKQKLFTLSYSPEQLNYQKGLFGLDLSQLYISNQSESLVIHYILKWLIIGKINSCGVY
jgi:hypothetical protein